MGRVFWPLVVAGMLATASGCIKKEPKNPKITIGNLKTLRLGARPDAVISVLGKPLPQDVGSFALENGVVSMDVWRYRGTDGDAFVIFNSGGLALVKINDDSLTLQSEY